MMNVEKVVEAINRTLNLSLDPVTTPQDDGFKSLGIDSLDFFNVLVELESMTGRNVPDEDVEKLTSIRSLVDYFS